MMAIGMSSTCLVMVVLYYDLILENLYMRWKKDAGLLERGQGIKTTFGDQ
jgi:hypothetical protein